MIELNSVSKQFDHVTVVNNISLQIKPGEIVGLLGPNGAGKTTTVRMIAGVLPPSKGAILINNQNLFDETVTNHPHIGYLPENNPLYDDMTVEEFLEFWCQIKDINDSEKKDTIREAVMAAGLKDVYYRPIAELSKGYRQRTGLAQAILSKPELLLLDEPTEGLDPNQRREIHDLIKGIGKKRTVIICSHVLAEITKMCSRIVIINKGQIVADALADELGSISEGKTTYELIAQGSQIKENLKKLPKVTDISEEHITEGSKWTVVSQSKEDLRLPIFELAKKNNWKLYELRRRQQDLEDIFVRLTK